MCTVSYLPKGKDSFILTSNRDEKLSRSKAIFPFIRSSNADTIVFPKDPDGGGSWIASTTQGKVVCLLNGAFYKHDPALFYKKSRGIVLLEVLEYDTMEEFSLSFNLENIAPFTLIAYLNEALIEFRWDGINKSFITLDQKKPYIWSSVTLYSEAIIAKRILWFKNLLEKNPDPTISIIRKFHHEGGEGQLENDLVMNYHNEYFTVSITSIVKKKDKISMIYEDLITKDKKQLTLKSYPQMVF